MKPKLRNIILRLLLLALSLACGACQSQESDPNITRRAQLQMGTLVEISVHHSDKALAQSAIGRAFDEISRIEDLMSGHKPDSETSRLNQNAGGEFIKVSPDLLKVLNTGIHWETLSKGALDITLGPVVRLWNFDAAANAPPSDEILKEALTRTGFQNIEIKDGKIRLTQPGMALELGSIAKGYAVDQAVKVLRENGVHNGLVNAGGDLRAFGTKDGKRPWVVGIQHPRKPQEILATLPIRNGAIATSGDYQRYFVKDGVRYHHILDPATGRPARGVMSFSVTAPTAMQADALATAAFVMGIEKGVKFLKSIPDSGALAVDDAGKQFRHNFSSP